MPQSTQAGCGCIGAASFAVILPSIAICLLLAWHRGCKLEKCWNAASHDAQVTRQLSTVAAVLSDTTSLSSNLID